MKHILTLVLIFIVISGYSQNSGYPINTRNIVVGYQTTPEGIFYRGDTVPTFTPEKRYGTFMYVDTVRGNTYMYYNSVKKWKDIGLDSLFYNSSAQLLSLKNSNEVALIVRTDTTLTGYNTLAQPLGVDTGVIATKYDISDLSPDKLYYPEVINKTGVLIKKGTLVMVDTIQLVQGDHVRIIPAVNNGKILSDYVMGVANQDISADALGRVSWFGYVFEVKHSDIAQTGVTLVAGDILYSSTTESGKFTNVPPTAPAHQSKIALLVRKPNDNNMTLLVRPWLAHKLDNLSNVKTSSAVNLSTLRYNNTTNTWDASTTPGIVASDTSAMLSYYLRKVDTLSLSNRINLKLNIADTAAMLIPYQKDITLTTSNTNGAATFNGVTLNVPQYQAALTNPVTGTGTAGQIAYWSGTTTQTGNNNLFYDATNASLGVGTNTPGGKITSYSNTNGRSVIENWNINTGSDTYSGFSNYTGNSNTGDSNFRLSALMAFPKNYTNPSYGGAYAAGGTTLWMYGASDTTNNNMVFAITQTVGNLSEANYNPSFRWVKATTNNYTIANELMRLNKTGLGIKQNTPLYSIDINATDGIRIPVGTTVQRPAALNNGVVRYNSTNNNIEYYANSEWENIPKYTNLTSGKILYGDSTVFSITPNTDFSYSSSNSQLTLHGGSTNSKISLKTNLAYYNLEQIGNYDFSINSSIDGSSSTYLYTQGTTGNVGIANTNPQRKLHVSGEVRITDLVTDSPTKIVGADNDGDLGSITIGSGLTLSSGTLSASGLTSTTGFSDGTSNAITITLEAASKPNHVFRYNNSGTISVSSVVINNPVAGGAYTIHFQDCIGAANQVTVTWPTTFKDLSGSNYGTRYYNSPTLVTCYYDGTNFNCN